MTAPITLAWSLANTGRRCPCSKAATRQAEATPETAATAAPGPRWPKRWSRPQLQTETLSRCFDPLPDECQKPAYLGLGVRLAPDGEIRGTWITRSTVEPACRVDECVAKVVRAWRFDPIGVSRTTVLPLQFGGRPPSPAMCSGRSVSR